MIEKLYFRHPFNDALFNIIRSSAFFFKKSLLMTYASILSGGNGRSNLSISVFASFGSSYLSSFSVERIAGIRCFVLWI